MHSWSSWSTAYNFVNDYYTFVGQTKAEYDVESKTQYLYYRWDPELNPVYRTKYHTEYKKTTKVLFVTVNTYDTVTSWNGYPGAVSGKTIHKQWTTTELYGYNGGNVHTDWRDSAPSISIFDSNRNPWQSYQSRRVYRYRTRTMNWNSEAEYTYEQTPLYYSLTDSNWKNIGLGAKYVWNSSLSGGNNMDGGSQGSFLTDMERYVLNIEAIELLLLANENALDEIIKQNPNFWFRAYDFIVDVASMFLNPPATVLFILSMAIDRYQEDYMTTYQSDVYNSVKTMLSFAYKHNILVAIDFYNSRFYSTKIVYDRTDISVFPVFNNYLSMHYQRNECANASYELGGGIGYVSYVRDISELNSTFIRFMDYKRW